MSDVAKEILEKLNKWIEGDPDNMMAAQETLDEYVHELKAAEAASINNEGFDKQIAFIVEKVGPEQAKLDILAMMEDEQG